MTDDHIKQFIDLLNANNSSSRSLADEADRFDDFEAWEGDYELRQAQDWPGLVRYYQFLVQRDPNDLYAKARLGEAYVLNDEPQRAIDYLAVVHQEEPGFGDVKHIILDALLAQGKSEDDFEWVEKPTVLRLNEAFLDSCYQHLRGKRRGQKVEDIYEEFSFRVNTIALFDRRALYETLKADGRFKVRESEWGVEESWVTIRR